MDHLYQVVIQTKVIKHAYIVRYDNSCMYGANMYEFKESDPHFIVQRKILHSNDFNKVFMSNDIANVMIVSDDILKDNAVITRARLILSKYINDRTIKKSKRLEIAEALRILNIIYGTF